MDENMFVCSETLFDLIVAYATSGEALEVSEAEQLSLIYNCFGRLQNFLGYHPSGTYGTASFLEGDATFQEYLLNRNVVCVGYFDINTLNRGGSLDTLTITDTCFLANELAERLRTYRYPLVLTFKDCNILNFNELKSFINRDGGLDLQFENCKFTTAPPETKNLACHV
jgi:hypothetical protein